MINFHRKTKGGLKMKNLKLASLIIAFFIGLLAINVNAVSNVNFNQIEVNGVDVTSGDTVYAERGDNIEIRVEIKSTTPYQDVNIKAWLGGYEYSDVEDITSMFDIIQGVTYSKFLNLQLPDDMEASEDYKLHIEVYNDDDSKEVVVPVKLQVQETRHKISIQDVIIRPSTNIEAGKPLFISVRVENMGAKNEDDIRVSASIPELGISSRDYIDELVCEQEDIDCDDCKNSASSNELFLRIPEDAKTGNYDVKIEVTYNRGHSTESKTEKIFVTGSKITEEKEAEGIISIDTTTQTIEQGQEIAYKLMFANLGDIKNIYSISISGTSSWADSRVEPSFITVDPNTTGESYIYIKAKDNAQAGDHSFNVKVISDSNVIKETTLTTKISEKQFAFGDLRNVLITIGIILIVILIILVIILAVKKSSEGRSEPEQGMIEGQTYYYYPRQ
jgi:uncharacterized membrane protein